MSSAAAALRMKKSASVSPWSISMSSIFSMAPACSRASPFIGWRASRTSSSFSRPASTPCSPKPSKSLNPALALLIGCAPFPSATGSETCPPSLAIYPTQCVYHLLGKIRKAPDCALWDDETLAFLRELDHHLRASGNLSAALHDSHLLFLGLSFDNWLLRFLVQVVKGKHLSELDRDQLYLSESQETAERDQVVVFFSRLTHQFRFIPMPPREFIAELVRRWRERHPQSPDDDALMKQAHRLAHRSPGCIFVSYASPDLPIAEYIVKQLQDKGLLVWFDKQQLLPGQDWEAEFSEAVEQTCGVFLSLISDTSAQRLTAYNILERNLASKRRDRFADSEVFYIPLRIDEGEPLVPANEPRGIKKIQAVRKSGGHLDDGFIEYLRQLQLEYIKRCGLTFTPPPPTP